MKRNKNISRIIFLILFFAINSSFVSSCKSEVKVVTCTNFHIIDSLIKHLAVEYTPSEVLIVLDIDNTLLTSSSDLGGDIWYQWQRGKLDIKPTEEQKVDRLFEDAIGLLYELGTMRLTDITIPNLICSWQEQGMAVFALTSRHPNYRAATERELNRNNIDFTKTAPRHKGEELPVYRYNLEREMSYMKGIMMTTGMNKGEMLQHILQKTDSHFKSIVFVDDSKTNINNMHHKFKHADIDMTIFCYEKIIEERKIMNGGMVLTKDQTERMDSDWKKLNTTLKEIFPNRYLEN